ATREPRIKVRFSQHGGISAATNSALDLASGDYIAFMDNDDVLTPDALAEYVSIVNARSDVEVIYSDEDKIDDAGQLSDPFFKPDWSPEFFRGVMYVGHLLMVKRTLVEQVGRLDGTYDGVQDFELMLRLSEHTDRIYHHKRIVYHWRKHRGSLAGNIDVKPISERQAAAVNSQLRRTGIAAIAECHPTLPHRTILRPSPRVYSWPTVTVVIPS